MTNLISRAVAHINAIINSFQIKRFLAIALVGFVVLTANVDYDRSNKAVTRKVDNLIHQDDSQRPKTTGEWNKEARETKGDPGERLKRIGKQSAEAVKDLGSVYPDTAKRSARELKENTAR
ncbi:hypothetical protein [Calothrix sp. PCC 7507]|uniref:hypothetical protein n=1 Tax=Calothrix sp. PCC 7507 TaxID=99598 RepID=UPI00029ECC28|nr:hypothetical protein [Calothrix sp. PCC 7507]AFY35046.1 hypothetical protein Cal7507_4685 [Calothrix sp. PCC 7507]